MVAPVTGPYSRTLSLPGPPNDFGVPVWFTQSASWFRQRKPYDLNLAYSMSLRSVVSVTPETERKKYNTSWLGSPEGPYGAPSALSKAYDKLTANLGSPSLWAVNIKERQKTFDLITSSASTLWKFSRALRKGRFIQAAKILRLALPPKGLKKGAQWFGDNWLKFHFGVEPLINDIGACIETLQKPFPKRRITGKGAFVSKVLINKGGNPQRLEETSSRCRLSVDVQINNPNLFRADQLGFLNPLTFLWEVIPFSFLVDWFANVGSFLASFSQFAGITQSNPATTYYDEMLRYNTWHSIVLQESFRSVYIQRKTTLDRPALHIRPWKDVSPSRAATSIALLLKVLKG